MEQSSKQLHGGNIILAIILVFAIAFIPVIWFVTYTTPAIINIDPLDEMHRQYNHFQMFEDGSYRGETTAGMKVTGCIRGGLCND